MHVSLPQLYTCFVNDGIGRKLAEYFESDSFAVRESASEFNSSTMLHTKFTYNIVTQLYTFFPACMLKQ